MRRCFPSKRAKFDNLTVWAPNNVIAFLQSKYGENLDPTMASRKEESKHSRGSRTTPTTASSLNDSLVEKTSFYVAFSEHNPDFIWEKRSCLASVSF